MQIHWLRPRPAVVTSAGRATVSSLVRIILLLRFNRRLRRSVVAAGSPRSVLSLPACTSADPSPVRIVDLVRDFRDAEARPSRAAFDVADVDVAGQSEPAIRTSAPSRLIYVLPVPRRSTFAARVALERGSDGAPPQPLRFRVGVSDDRIYEQLASVVLTPGVQTGWTDLRANLSAYAGWQWSIFYRPEGAPVAARLEHRRGQRRARARRVGSAENRRRPCRRARARGASGEDGSSR